MPPSRLRRIFALAIGVSLISACAGARDGSSTPVPVEFKVIDHENSRIQDAQEVVLRDQAAYAALWAKHGTSAPLPPVDFNRNMVAAVFAGNLGDCVWIEVTRVLHVPDRTTIEYQKAAPEGLVMCAAVLRYLAVWIVVPRMPGEVVFVRKPSSS